LNIAVSFGLTEDYFSTGPRWIWLRSYKLSDEFTNLSFNR